MGFEPTNLFLEREAALPIRLLDHVHYAACTGLEPANVRFERAAALPIRPTRLEAIDTQPAVMTQTQRRALNRHTLLLHNHDRF